MALFGAGCDEAVQSLQETKTPTTSPTRKSSRRVFEIRGQTTTRAWSEGNLVNI